MNVRCPSCQTVYRIDPAKVPASGVRAECSVCSHILAVTRAPEAAASVPRAPMVSRESRETTEAMLAAELGDAFIPAPPDEAVGTAGVAARSPEPTPAAPAAKPATSAPPPSAAPASEPAQRPPAPAKPMTGSPSANRVSRPFTHPGASRPESPPAPARPRPTAPVFRPTPGQPVQAPPVPPPTPAPVAAPAAPSPGPRPEAGGKPVNPFLTRNPQQKARRLARALVSDMIVYQPEKRERALREGTLKQVFEDEIKKSWEEYVEQVGPDVANSTPYFAEALNEILAGGESIF